MRPDELPILIEFEALLHWSFDRCASFPKILRPTLSHRFQTHLLDALEQLLELRYTRQRSPLFRRVNLTFETLRFLSRALHQRRAFSTAQYEHFNRQLNAIGQQLGGWQRSLRQAAS